jgi:hypothetical protein
MDRRALLDWAAEKLHLYLDVNASQEEMLFRLDQLSL